MALANGNVSVDMNDPLNLSFYTDMILFKADPMKNEMVIQIADSSQGRVLHLLAHKLQLVYDDHQYLFSVRILRSDFSSTSPLGTPAPASSKGNASSQYQKQSNQIGEVLSQDLDETFSEYFHDGPVMEERIAGLQSQERSISGLSALANFNEDQSSDINFDLDFDSFVNEGEQEIVPNFFSCDISMSGVWESNPVFPEVETNLLASADLVDPFPIAGPAYDSSLSRGTTRIANLSSKTAEQELGPKEEEVLRSSKSPKTNSPRNGKSSCSNWPWNEGARQSRLKPSDVISLKESLDSNADDDCSYQGERTTHSQYESSASSADIGSVPRQRRIPKRFSRVSGNNRRNSGSYEGYESVFDSNSMSSAASSSAMSNSSGRRRPLDALAKAGMKAVRAFGGACWRCKILRKVCGVNNPCNSCPRNLLQSNWQAVGCQRGSLQSEMLVIPLCHHLAFSNVVNAPVSENEAFLITWPYASANKFSESIIARREIEKRERLLNEKPLDAEADAVQQITGFRPPIPQRILSYLCHGISSSDETLPPALVPLDDCILAIRWEFFNMPGRFVSDESHQMFVAFRAAALYQADFDSNQLISQSLICLRGAFELLRLEDAGHLHKLSHKTCTTFRCECNGIANFTESLALYLKELSRVFFNKGSTRKIQSWWLSAFYSFYIQSRVRKVLALINSLNGSGSGSWYYLQRAVRLFIASSGGHDPLLQDYHLPYSYEKVATRIEDYKIAQVAVRRKYWAFAGIKSSEEYLRNMFQDDGKEIPAPIKHRFDSMLGWDSEEDIDTH